MVLCKVVISVNIIIDRKFSCKRLGAPEGFTVPVARATRAQLLLNDTNFI